MRCDLEHPRQWSISAVSNLQGYSGVSHSPGKEVEMVGSQPRWGHRDQERFKDLRPAHRPHQHPQAERLKAKTIIISSSSWRHWAVTRTMAVSLEEPIPTQPSARPRHRGQRGCREPAGTVWQLESPTPQTLEVKEIMPWFWF